MSVEERWWSCIEKASNGCWVWKGVPNKSGYGGLKVNGKTVLAHRFGYEMLRGSIPEGMQIDHLCRNRLCVNPEHLEIVTSRVNTLRGDTIAAKEFRQTHCIRGHLLSGENLKMRANGKRICRQCKRIREKLLYWKRKAEKAIMGVEKEMDYEPVVET